MTLLTIGLILFFGIHLVPLTPLKAPFQIKFGEGAYKGIFSIVSLIGLILIIWGFASTRGTPVAADTLYTPPAWGRHLNMTLMLVAFICFAIYLHKGRLKAWLRHPMSIAIALWSIGHLISNGDLPGFLVFGSFLIYALLDIVVETARGTRPRFVPKPKHDIIAPVAGVIMYVAMLFLHPYVIGVPVLSM
ncbi:putative membrane protein [Rhodoligotrophos appendicifer]|uniref:NnrU family protein n=1 Tax=Rhodoligotrophos appendicifer TaxID=987056 RepID=UPI0014793C0F|nr:NnrU family protein [Rhodoligotrophos appendicifer]